MRCVHEAQLHEDNCFLTLTYDDKHLPKKGSLILSDYQDFMKRLREDIRRVSIKAFIPKKIRYYHCGEYGDKGRPHYHAILFNHDFTDKVLYKITEQEHRVYTSKLLDETWQNGKAWIADVSFDSAAYVAGYIMKKITNKNAVVDSNGVYHPPAAEMYEVQRGQEYATMSRRPGIGTDWYKKYKSDVYPSDEVIIKERVTRPPKFYDNMLDKEDPDLLESLKLKRKQKAVKHQPKRLKPGQRLTTHHLKTAEVCKMASISTLKRHTEL